ncbi:MAG: hypothetical protein AAFW73_26640 [Bacteroidota bacterium]
MTALLYPIPEIALVPRGKLGVTNIKKSFGFLLNIAGKSFDLAANFSWGEAVDLGFTLAGAQGMRPVFKAALAEFKDLDEAESREVTAFVEERFDIENNNLEATIEDGIELLPEIYATFQQNIRTYQKVSNYLARFKKP